jgi:hypothetical protein
MKFSTIAFFAVGAVAAVVPDVEEPVVTAAPTSEGVQKFKTSTVYETIVHTITDCEDDIVTDCPADATKVITETIAVSTTVCPDDGEETESPEVPDETSTYCPPGEETEVPEVPDEETETVSPPEVPTETEAPVPECPQTKVRTITTSYTTVIPTTIVETFTEDCPAPTGVLPPVPSHGGNGTIPEPSAPVEAGAGSVVGSVFVAAAAGVFAYAFA